MKTRTTLGRSSSIGAALLCVAFLVGSVKFVIAVSSPVPKTGKIGFIDIDPKKVANGLFDGDAPGLPVTISQPGSYRLIGHLSVPDYNTTGIEITTGDVTLDLNGFGVEGPNSCPGCPGACVGSGSGVGVYANGQFNVTVRNGYVVGMGYAGVRLIDADGAKVENVSVIYNAGDGSAVTDNAVTGGAVGIFVATSGSVMRNTITHTSSWALELGANVGVTENVLYDYVGTTGGVSVGHNLCSGAPC